MHSYPKFVLTIINSIEKALKGLNSIRINRVRTNEVLLYFVTPSSL